MIIAKNSIFGPIFIFEPILESDGYFWHFGSVLGRKVLFCIFENGQRLKMGPTLPVVWWAEFWKKNPLSQKKKIFFFCHKIGKKV